MASGTPTQHSSYAGEIQTLFVEINEVMDNMATPTYTNEDELIQALQGLHVSELLGFDDDGADEDGANDIDAPLRAISGDIKDYTMGGSENCNRHLAR